MEIRMTEQCLINLNTYDERMRDQWKLEWINNARWMELEWLNNARSMEIRMTEQCLINLN